MVKFFRYQSVVQWPMLEHGLPGFCSIGPRKYITRSSAWKNPSYGWFCKQTWCPQNGLWACWKYGFIVVVPTKMTVMVLRKERANRCDPDSHKNSTPPQGVSCAEHRHWDRSLLSFGRAHNCRGPQTQQKTPSSQSKRQKNKELCRVSSSGLLMGVDIYLVRKKIKKKTQIMGDVCIMKN